MDFSSMESIKAAGFAGFESIRALQLSDCINAPSAPGVYLVLRENPLPPRFITQSPAGRFKGKDPTVSLSELERNWVEGALVLYIGKAGGGTTKNVLRKRLRRYMRFGAGEPADHWGGRLIWQLEDSRDLLVCWRPCATVDAAQLESALIQDFARAYGNRPFANLRD